MGLIVVLALVLAAEFVNGWTDAPNAIATVVSTRVLSPGTAVIMATVLNAVGVMSGTAVAVTIGKGIVQSQAINLTTVGAAMVSIVPWSTLAWYFLVLTPARAMRSFLGSRARPWRLRVPRRSYWADGKKSGQG